MPKVVAIVPCRKLSKRLPKKNKLPFYGKPLFQWTVELALQLDFIDEIIVATDDEEIMDITIDEYVGERVRIFDDYLAGEHGRPTRDIVKDCLEGYSLDTVVIWLQPTTPLRSINHVSNAYHIFKTHPIPLVGAYIDPVNKRFQHNGGMYIITLEDTLQYEHLIGGAAMLTYFIDEKDSVDIDTIEDFHLAEKRMEERLRNE